MSRVSRDKFPKWENLTAPDGSRWIQDATDRTKPLWCPGRKVPIRYFSYADHNGVYRWEAQPSADGTVTEEGFKNFTSWRYFNMDNNTKYYAEDGRTPLKPGVCIRDGLKWTPGVAACRPGMFAETELAIPADMAPGPTTMRWFWYGAMTTAGARVDGPEHSLFVNCVDVEIGTPDECENLPTPA